MQGGGGHDATSVYVARVGGGGGWGAVNLFLGRGTAQTLPI